MTRTLPIGRLTKQDPGEAIRAAGTIGGFNNKGIFGDFLDQFLFEGHGYEHILGSASQVSSDFATITWDQGDQQFEDKSGAEVVLSNGDRIAVIGMDVLTANLVIDNIKGLEIFHIAFTPGQTGVGAPLNAPKFQLGDAGSGEPFRLVFGPNTSDCKLDLQTDKQFDVQELFNLSLDKRQFIMNQGVRNHIRLNGEVIYNPSEAGQIIKLDNRTINPYLIRLDGSFATWQNDTAVSWFRDLNIKLGGQRWDGTNFIETASKFTLPITITNFPERFQVNIALRFFTSMLDLTSDPRLHVRSDPTGVVTPATADFTIGSNVVTFQGGIGNIKNGMRISGASTDGIPDGAIGTTILRNINITAGTAEMFTAIGRFGVAATATFNGRAVTIDNSGAAGGSQDTDFFQNFTGSFDIASKNGGDSTITLPTGVFTSVVDGGSGTTSGLQTVGPTQDDLINFDASNSGARTHSQTQPISSGAIYYYKA